MHMNFVSRAAGAELFLAWVCLASLGCRVALAAPEFQTLPELSLENARQFALLNNWDLLAAKSDVDLAQAQQLVAREFPNPTLSLLTSKINLEHGRGTVLGNSFFDRSYDSVAAVSQLLEIGGKRASRRASANAAFMSAEARFRDARRLLDFGVARTYIAAVQLEANAGILRRSAETMRKEADIAAVRQKAGDISTSDQAQIEVTAARLEQDARAAAVAARANKIALENLLGSLHPNGDWRATDSLETLAESLAGNLKEAPLANVETRPDVIAAELNRKRAGADWRLQKALRIPDPTFTVQYEHEPPDTLNSLGLGVSFPIPLWNHNRGNIAAAAAARRQADVQAEKIRAQAVAEVLTARAAFVDAAERFARYRTEIAPKSAKVRAAVAFSYDKGGATLLDLLSAERTDNEVRLASAQAATDAATTAAALRAALNQGETKSQP